VELNYFKDQLFDLLNESELDLAEIESDERSQHVYCLYYRRKQV